jgi:hypothetical protein
LLAVVAVAGKLVAVVGQEDIELLQVFLLLRELPTLLPLVRVGLVVFLTEVAAQ